MREQIIINADIELNEGDRVVGLVIANKDSLRAKVLKSEVELLNGKC